MLAIVQEAVKELSNFEKCIARWDIGIKIFGAAGVIVGGFVSFWQYRNQQKKEAQDNRAQKNRELNQRAQELRMKVFDREFELYSRASTAASQIAVAAEKRIKNEAAETEFWELYWGPLCIFETPPIEAAMVQLGDALQQRDKAERDKAQKQQDTAQQNIPGPSEEVAAAENLKELSYKLAQEIRAYLQSQYKDQKLKAGTL